jgi:hypothetical protein
MRYYILTISFIMFFALSSTVFANAPNTDTDIKIHLHSGKVYTGRIIRELKKGYLFKTAENKTIVIPFEQVKKIISATDDRVGHDRNNRDDNDADKPPPAGSGRADNDADEPPPAGSGRADLQNLNLRYALLKKGFAGPIILNILLPFAIGSWVANDYIGGGIGTGLQVTGLALMLPLYDYYLSPMMLPVGIILFTIGYIVPLITTPISIARYNRRLRQRIFGNRHASLYDSNNLDQYAKMHLPRVSFSPVVAFSF